jgi:putative membrane protein
MMIRSLSVGDYFVLAVGLLHVGISVTEIFFWNKLGLYKRIERLQLTVEESRKAAPIVANAGLYNGFIAAGLIWGALSPNGGTAIEIFFLGCVIVAGIFGAITLKWTTVFLQTVPAALALVVVWISRNTPEGRVTLSTFTMTNVGIPVPCQNSIQS